MTIRHLRIFIQVADCGKMSLAATNLYISQPSVSQAISEIESFYSVRLFERLSRKLYITESGEKLLEYSRHIVALFDEMERSMKNSSVDFLLKIGASVTVGTCVLSDIINQFNNENPTIKTEVLIDNTQVMESKILRSELDVAIVEGKIKSKDIISLPIINDRLVLICNKVHPFANRKFVTLSELDNQPFILRENGSGTRELFEKLMQDNGYSICKKWICNNSEAIKKAVIDGHGLSVISEMLIKDEVKMNKLKIVKVEDINFSRKFSIIYHKNKYLSKYLSKFIEICKSTPL